jgi:FkbM family methyltransferase
MNTLLIRARSVARKLGILARLKAVHSMFHRSYEEHFDTALLAHIQSGDVVWDIGANLGLYTEKFLDKVGSGGVVVAFEPVSDCFDVLRSKFTGKPNVTLEPLALSSCNGIGTMKLAADPLGATHQLVDREHSGSEMGAQVAIVTADSYVACNRTVPNVIKMDVEGFEYEVFKGMKALLTEPKLRGVFCEMHFALLESRGQMFAPVEIERLLSHAGFKVEYTDSSHIQAVRTC